MRERPSKNSLLRLIIFSNTLPCDHCNDKVMKKLVVETPSSMLVEAYLAEIASGYGVKWTSPTVDGKGAKETTPEVWCTVSIGIHNPYSSL